MIIGLKFLVLSFPFANFVTYTGRYKILTDEN